MYATIEENSVVEFEARAFPWKTGKNRLNLLSFFMRYLQSLWYNQSDSIKNSITREIYFLRLKLNQIFSLPRLRFEIFAQGILNNFFRVFSKEKIHQKYANKKL